MYLSGFVKIPIALHKREGAERNNSQSTRRISASPTRLLALDVALLMERSALPAKVVVQLVTLFLSSVTEDGALTRLLCYGYFRKKVFDISGQFLSVFVLRKLGFLYKGVFLLTFQLVTS